MLLAYIFNCLIIGYSVRAHLPIKQPIFKNDPLTVRSKENEVVFLPCLVDEIGGSYVRWWKDQTLLRDSRRLPTSVTNKFTVMDDGLTIEYVSADDAGEYTCEVVRPEPWSPLKLTHILQVLYPPRIFPSPPDGYIEVLLGDKVRIGCSATGVPTPVISWRTNGIIIESGDTSKERLEFTASSRKMSGIYQCEANNGIGEPARTNILLRILHPPEVEVEKTWVHSAPGVETALVCRVLSEPESQVVWLYNKETLKSSPPRLVHKTRGNENVLLFNPVAGSDFGNYTCMASNRLGTAEQVVQLSGVANAPAFTMTQSKPPDGFTLVWEADSFSPIFEYKLFFRKEHDSQWVNIIIPADSSFPSGPLHSQFYTISGLDRTVVYETKVKCRNRFGWSESSEIIKFGFTKPPYVAGEESDDHLTASASSIAAPTTIYVFFTIKLFLYICDIS